MTTLAKNLLRQASLRARKSAVLFATLLCFILQTVPLHATVNVVSYWRMGENDPGAARGVTATNTIDSIGTNNLTFTGAAQYTNDVAATAASATGSSLSVNFTNSAYATNTIVSTNVDNFGIECWVKPTAPGGGQVIFYNGSTGGIGDGGWGILAANGTYEVLFGGVVAFGAAPVATNVWTHLALVRASGVASLYVNGVAVATNTATPGIPTAGCFALATTPQNPSSPFFTGLMDEVRVFTFAAGQFSTNDLLLNEAVTLSTTNLLEPASSTNDTLYLGASSSYVSWTNVANAAWLHLTTSGGTGSANIAFSVDANPGGPRTGIVTIAGQTVTVTQAGVTYVPAIQIGILFNNIATASGMVVDPSGNVYASSGSTIYKWSPGNASATQLITSGLSTPVGLAVDNANNLYIANNGGSSISKWIAAGNTLTTLFSTPPNPDRLALDFAGNVYFDCSGVSNRLGVFRWSPVDGSVTRALTGPPSTIDNYLGLAVDAGSDIFYGVNYIFEGQRGGQVIEQTAGGAASGIVDFPAPVGVAVDRVGTLYVSDSTLGTIEKSSPPYSTWSGIASGLGATQLTIAVDNARNFYYAAGGIRELPYAFVDPSVKSASADGGSGQLPVVLPVNANLTGPFYPTTGQSWITISGVTNGVVYYSVAANTNSPRSGGIFLLGQTIPVQQAGVVYSPGTTNLVEGPASGTDSVELYVDPPVATWTVTTNGGWLHPVGTNGAGSTNIIFTFDQNPGATRVGSLTIGGQTVTVTQAGFGYQQASEVGLWESGATNSSCLAGDAAGDVYFIATNGVISEWLATNQTVIGLVSDLVDPPAGLAVDQTGDLYFSDPSNHAVLEWMSGSGTVSTVVSNGTMVPLGVALDVAGDVYFSDASDQTVKEWTAKNGLSTIVTNGLAGPVGIAVDTIGNIYIADPPANSVRKWTAGGGGLGVLVSGLGSAQSVAVDGSGNVYAAGTQTNVLLKWTFTTGAVTALGFPGVNTPKGVVVDAAQNVYAEDGVSGSIDESPDAFVDGQGRQEPLSAGTDALPAVVPATANLGGSFTPISDQGWLTYFGATNGVVNFSFTTNDTGSSRIAHINVLGTSVLVLQGQPVFRLGIDHRLEGPAAGVDSVLLGLNPDVGAWTASANATWLHLDVSAQSGNFDTNVVFSFDANPGPTRTGTLTVAGLTFTVIQAGSNYVQAGGLPAIIPVESSPGIPAIAADNNGNIYYGYYGSYEINKWNPTNGMTTAYSEENHSVGLELTSSDGGVLSEDHGPVLGYTMVDFAQNATEIIELSEPYQEVTSAVADDSGNMYFTFNFDEGQSGCLSQFSITNYESTSIFLNISSPILASNYSNVGGVARDRAGNVYFGADGGIYKCSARSKTTSPLNTATLAAFSTVADGAGNLYMAYITDSVEKYTAATQTHAAIVTGLNYACTTAVDGEQNVYIGTESGLYEIPYVFVVPTPITIGGGAGSGALPQVLPAMANMFPPFTPTNDQPWLTITGTSNGIVTFTVTANTTGTNRTSNIRLFNQTIPVTQSILISPPVLTGPTSTNGAFGFMFTNNQTTNFSVLFSTNLATPLSNWNLLGAPSNISPGVFQFTTPDTNSPQGFYRVSSP